VLFMGSGVTETMVLVSRRLYIVAQFELLATGGSVTGGSLKEGGGYEQH
jgi:hypothetical protein